jgi:hypothetical protein
LKAFPRAYLRESFKKRLKTKRRLNLWLAQILEGTNQSDVFFAEKINQTLMRNASYTIEI